MLRKVNEKCNGKKTHFTGEISVSRDGVRSEIV